MSIDEYRIQPPPDRGYRPSAPATGRTRSPNAGRSSLGDEPEFHHHEHDQDGEREHAPDGGPVGGGVGELRIDHGFVRAIHQEVGDRLQSEQGRRRASGRSVLEGLGEQHFARKLVMDVLQEHAEERLERGETPMDAEVERRVAEGVFARMFGAGRLQDLLNDESIENIDINGADEVWITRAGSAVHERGPRAAESDEELIDLIQSLAAYAGLNSRPWDAANPELDLQLPDGSRLSAVMGVTARPSVSIRRHRFESPTLDDLVENQTMTGEAADFLRAVIRSRANTMIAGATRAGKTTLLRAMASEIDPRERIITVEKSLELGLRRNRQRHPNCVEFEERMDNSEGQGGVGMSRLVRRTLRQNPDRVIVGEVLGPEVVDMLNAMGQGNDGSLSTIHCRTARDAFNRIATYAIQSGERLPREATFQLIAGGLDYVVFISRHPRSGERRLDTVLEVNQFDAGEGSGTAVLGSSAIFELGSGGVAQWTGTVPMRADALDAVGWIPPADPAASGWWSP